MTPDEGDRFYEDDEDPQEVARRYEEGVARGRGGVTAPPPLSRWTGAKAHPDQMGVLVPTEVAVTLTDIVRILLHQDVPAPESVDQVEQAVRQYIQANGLRGLGAPWERGRQAQMLRVAWFRQARETQRCVINLYGWTVED